MSIKLPLIKTLENYFHEKGTSTWYDADLHFTSIMGLDCKLSFSGAIISWLRFKKSEKLKLSAPGLSEHGRDHLWPIYGRFVRVDARRDTYHACITNITWFNHNKQSRTCCTYVITYQWDKCHFGIKHWRGQITKRWVC